MSVPSPTLRKSGPHTPTWKKVKCPPQPKTLPVHARKSFNFKTRSTPCIEINRPIWTKWISSYIVYQLSLQQNLSEIWRKNYTYKDSGKAFWGLKRPKNPGASGGSAPWTPSGAPEWVPGPSPCWLSCCSVIWWMKVLLKEWIKDHYA